LTRNKTPANKRLVIYHVQAKQFFKKFFKNWAIFDDSTLLKFQLTSDIIVKTNRNIESRSMALANIIDFAYQNRFLLVNSQRLKEISDNFYSLWTATHDAIPHKSSEIFEVAKMNQQYQCPPFIPDLFKSEQSFDTESEIFSLNRTQHTEFNRGYGLFYYAQTGQQLLEEKLKSLTRKPIRLV